MDLSTTSTPTSSISFTTHHFPSHFSSDRPSGIPRPSWATHGFPTFSSPLPSSLPPTATSHHGPSLAAIVFETLGGLAGLMVALSFLRCIYSYRKTPERDRISSFVSRHNLEEELAQRALRPSGLERRPPPPYFPRPPSYEGLIRTSADTT